LDKQEIRAGSPDLFAVAKLEEHVREQRDQGIPLNAAISRSLPQTQKGWMIGLSKMKLFDDF
jgi:hypothetical protein